MEVAEVNVPIEEAKRKLKSCLEEGHADSQEYARMLAAGYEAIAAGHRVIHLSKSIRNGGFDAKGRPRIAIGRADRDQVCWDWPVYHDSGWFVDADCTSWRDRYPSLIRYVDVRPRPKAGSPRGFSLIPKMPPDVRPSRGQLREWYILFEVEEWSDNRIGPAPADPYLLKPIGGELYAVLAEWNLTALEMAVLEDMNR